MFLSALNDNEKELFLNLIINTAEADGEFTDLEKSQIQAYCNEMAVELKDRSSYSLKSSEVIQKLSNSSDLVKKAIFAEVIALMLVDGMADEEKELLEEIKTSFGFDDSYKNEVIDWYKQILPLYKKGFELIGLKFG